MFKLIDSTGCELTAAEIRYTMVAGATIMIEATESCEVIVMRKATTLVQAPPALAAPVIVTPPPAPVAKAEPKAKPEPAPAVANPEADAIFGSATAPVAPKAKGERKTKAKRAPAASELMIVYTINGGEPRRTPPEHFDSFDLAVARKTEAFANRAGFELNGFKLVCVEVTPKGGKTYTYKH